MVISNLSKRIEILLGMAPDLKSLLEIMEDGTFFEVLTVPDVFIEEFFEDYWRLAAEL